MSWIKIIPFKEAQGKLKKLYQKVTGPNNNVDNIMMVHGLRPHTMTGHMSLYKNVLHNSNNTLPKWYLETIGVFVSFLNNCDYCVDHHYEGLKRLLDNDAKASEIKESLIAKKYGSNLIEKFSEGLKYAEKLTKEAHKLTKLDIEKLTEKGLTDGEVLEINQVVSYFNYANRTVLGLGVSTEGDILGLSPNNSEEEENWSHQ